MSLRNTFFAIAVLGALTHVVSLVLIMAALDRRGQKTNPLLVRIYAFKYLAAYKEAMIKETGKAGVLYRLCIVGILVALVAAVAGILVRRI